MNNYSWMNRPPTTKEKGGGPVLVDRAGYVPAKKRIEAIMLAGKQLLTARREEYDADINVNIDNLIPDPTRSPGYDLADAAEQTAMINARRRNAAEAAKRKITPPSPTSSDEEAKKE